MKLNQAIIEGEVIDTDVVDNGFTFKLKQNVANRDSLCTTFEIFIPKDLDEDVYASGIKVGSRVLVNNALAYQKSDGSFRFRVSDISQILLVKEPLHLNQLNITGTIEKIKDVPHGLEITIWQYVANREGLKTKFQVLIPGRMKEQIPALQEGDKLLVNNGLMYQKDETFWVKVSAPTQIQLSGPKSLDKGIVEAKEMFM